MSFHAPDIRKHMETLSVKELRDKEAALILKIAECNYYDDPSIVFDFLEEEKEIVQEVKRKKMASPEHTLDFEYVAIQFALKYYSSDVEVAKRVYNVLKVCTTLSGLKRGMEALKPPCGSKYPEKEV